VQGCGLTVGRRTVMPIGLTRAVCRSLAAVIQLVRLKSGWRTHTWTVRARTLTVAWPATRPTGGRLAVVGRLSRWGGKESGAAL